MAEDVQVYDEQIATMPLDSAQSNTTGQDEKSSKSHSEIEPLSFLPSVKDMRKFARDIIFPSETTIENVGTVAHGEFSSWLVGPTEDRKMYISEPIKISKNKNIFEITKLLNKILEKMILKNIDQWIWTHDRWKH